MDGKVGGTPVAVLKDWFLMVSSFFNTDSTAVMYAISNVERMQAL